MSLEFVNRICPNCKNPNYMVLLGDFSKAYKYKCMNCNRYFNDIDFDEPSEPVWKTEWINKKIDMVEVVRCKDCINRGKSEKCVLAAISEEKDCPLFMLDNRGEWFCADGERR